MRFGVGLTIVLAGLYLSGQSNSVPARNSSAGTGSDYVPVHKFDSKRDSAADIRAAVAEAQRTGKRIILDIGGDWCQYCHEMDKLLEDHPDILALRDKNFIAVAIYYGDDNKNPQVLSHYSKVLGIPHFFVLEKDGSLLHSQHLLDLRTNGKYDPAKVKEFFLKWSPPRRVS